MEIAAPRLILRDFTPADLPSFVAYHADPRHTEFYGPEEDDPDRLWSIAEKFLIWAAEQPRRNYQLAIFEREGSQTPIGSCGVRLEGCEPGTGEFGLELAADYWGRGFATEAARAILDFAFRDLGVREVRGLTVTENTRVQRLVERLCFTRAEPKPGPDWMRERGWSQTEWRMTAEEWVRVNLGILG